MLSKLGLRLDWNVPKANQCPKLCTVSIIFRLDGLELKKRKESYSSLDRISDVYVCMRIIEFFPEEV